MDVYHGIIEYLKEKYDPESILVYGSFADGSNNAFSDFDALVIAEGEKTHDDAMVFDTVLDVFVYPPQTFREEYDPDEFIQVIDGRIEMDQNGLAQALREQIAEYVRSQPLPDREQNRDNLAWCEKMLCRVARDDAEGRYRAHWLLTDSLSFYFDLRGERYFGPKKALRFLEKNDPNAFAVYDRALRACSYDTLKQWIDLLKRMDEQDT